MAATKRDFILSSGIGISANDLYIVGSTASTNSTSGALIVSGGVGIGGDLNVASNITGTAITATNSILVESVFGTVTTTQFASIFAKGIGGNSGGLMQVKGNDGTTGLGMRAASSTYNGFYSNGQIDFRVGSTIRDNDVPTGGTTYMSLSTTGVLALSSSTASTSTTSGALTVTGGAGIGQSVSVGGRLQLFNSANYTAFVSSASGNTVYTLPATSPATGSSVLQSTSAGVMSWVPMTAGSSSGNTSQNIVINTAGNANVFHPVLLTPSPLSAGSAVSSDSTITFNPSTEILNVSGLAITSGTASTNTTTGALVVTGGMGIGGNAFIGGTTTITNTTASVSSSTGALVVAGGVGIGGTLNVGADLSISGLTTLTFTSEKLNTKTSAGSAGTVTHDLSTGSVFYHSSISNNFTANFTNVPTTNDRALGVTLILAQGGTPYMSTALQIDGSAQTIKWVNNTTPTGTASKVDIVGFSLIRTGSAWTVLGQYSTYG